ncbi:glutathione binding-like protein [Candidatus Berkiella aquae]|uniref:Disulfide-bond oxidoreductase YfcG n=1 Tax=Candidatus Berkiella aquae TaxID=295108 RepID=A0A0Q9YVD9_9GAMM|nr:glutathione binding-like protein [Candidatus Berkiella aquae]MCS5711610.1 glutathione S-transferase N-terminal domain-containing protein [Candidatus Berkiella aquae]
MIDLYYWTTPNGHKITIFLEEAGLPYRIIPVNIAKNEQFKPDFLQISPNNKIPAIVDHSPNQGKEPFTLFESGAILLYLAKKANQFIASDAVGYYRTLEWLIWQNAGLGPMCGQANHFMNFAPEKIPYAIERYQKEAKRLYSVLEKQLSAQDYIADEYSIADMACYPWIVPHKALQINLDDYPAIKRWFFNLRERPAIQKAYALAKEINPT